MGAVDLSAVIFVVLALAWAVYLIPKALKHHDEMASDRLEHGHSDRVRILSRHRSSEPAAPTTPEPSTAEAVVVEEEPAPVRVPTRAAARRAARNRRRVLGVLLAALAVVTGLAALAVLPWWTVALPAVLTVAFLVLARLSVRAAYRVRAAHPTSVAPETAGATDETTAETTDAPADEPVAGVDAALEELAHDPVGVPRQELEAALADDGSLWDPLPLTLPTYVGKARARRTVRTIELTGMNSSGHDESDSALAREAEQTGTESPKPAEQRRVAGA